MSNLSGTNLSARIVPFTTEDQYATHLAKYGQGGWHEVSNIQERDSITLDRLEVGMAVYVVSESSLYILDSLNTTTTPATKVWVEFQPGSGNYIRKVNLLPTASLVEDETVQYVGPTTQDYINGYFYKHSSTTTIENWVNFETSSIAGTVCTCSFEDFRAFLDTVDYIDPTEVVRGRFGYYSENLYSITLYNSTEFIKYFTLSPTQLENYGFNFTPPLAERDGLSFTCAVNKTVVNESWNQVDVQPRTTVIDNTTTQSSTAALSANMGYVLQEMINNKIDQTSTASMVYGTDSNGSQTVYNVDSFATTTELDEKTDTFIFDMAVATSTWRIVHNLDKFPSVTVVDSSGNFIEGSVQYINNNIIEIIFNAAFTGTAYLN